MRGFPFLRSHAGQLLPKPEPMQEHHSSKEGAPNQDGKLVATDILDEEIFLLGCGNVGPGRSAGYSGRDKPGRHDVVEISESQACSISEDVLLIGSAAPASDSPGGMAVARADKLQELRSTAPNTPAPVLPQIRLECAATPATGVASTVPSEQKADAMGTCMHCGCWALLYMHVPRCSARADRGAADGERFHCGQSWDAARDEGGGGQGFTSMPAPSHRAILSSERSSLLKRKRDVGNQSNGDRTTSRCDGPDTARKSLTFCKVERQDNVTDLEMKSPAPLHAVLKEKENFKAQLHSARKEISSLKQERDKLSRELKMTTRMRETDTSLLESLRQEKSAAEKAQEEGRHNLQKQQKLHEDELATQRTTTNTLQAACTKLQEENNQLRAELHTALEDRKAALSTEKKAMDADLQLKDSQSTERRLLKSHSALQDKLKVVEGQMQRKDQESAGKIRNLKSQQRKAAKDLNAVRMDLKAAENGLKAEKRQKEICHRDLSKLKEALAAMEKESTGKISSNQRMYEEKLASLQKIGQDLDAKLQEARMANQEGKVQADSRVVALGQSHGAKVAYLEQAHEAKVVCMKQAHEAEVVSLEQAHQKRVSSVCKELEAEVNKYQELQQATLASLRNEQAEKLLQRTAHEATLATLTCHQQEHKATLATLASCRREHDATLQVHADKLASLQRQEAEGIACIQRKHKLEMEALEREKNERIDVLILRQEALHREKEAQAVAHHDEKVAIFKEKEAEVHQLLQEKVLLEKKKEDCLTGVLRQHEASKVEWQTSIEEALAREQEWKQQLKIAKNESLKLSSTLRENTNLIGHAATAKLADACMMSLARRNNDLQREVKLSKDCLVSMAREKAHLDHESWDLKARLLSSEADRERLQAEATSHMKMQEDMNLVIQDLEKREKDVLHKCLQCRSFLCVVDEMNAGMQLVTEDKSPLCEVDQMDDVGEPIAGDELDLSVDASTDRHQGSEYVYPECFSGRTIADARCGDEYAFPVCPPQQAKEDVQDGAKLMTLVPVQQEMGEARLQYAEVGPPFCIVGQSYEVPRQNTESVYSSVVHVHGNLEESVNHVSPMCSLEPMNEDLLPGRQCISSLCVAQPMEEDQGVGSMEPFCWVDRTGAVVQERDSGSSLAWVAAPFKRTLEQEREELVGGCGGAIVVYGGPEKRLPQFSVMPGLARISLRAHLEGVLRLFYATRDPTAIVPHRPLQIMYADQDRP